MGMQSEADETPNWDGDFAFLRDDEISGWQEIFFLQLQILTILSFL